MLNALFTDAEKMDIERRTEVFNIVALDFGTEVGKVGFQHLFYDIS